MYILQLSLICLCDIDLPTSSTNWCSHYFYHDISGNTTQCLAYGTDGPAPYY